ncbi:MAG TPA: hypothetical protein VKD26_14215 [Streptosporangiaceae bacterium]|nr:hypothetical protein [Streptosporangiaceae bacterium]
MHDRPIPRAPWRLLILDRSDPDDARWLLATVELADDVQAAVLDQIGHYGNWPQVCTWVRQVVGRADISLIPLPAPLAWRVDEGQQR